VEVDELAPGLWRWTAHLEGRGDVASLYVESETSISLIDPVVPPEDRQGFLRALDRDVERHSGPVHIVLSSRNHEARAAELVERYGADVWTPDAEEPPGELAAIAAGRPGYVMFWLADHRTLYAGECLYRVGGRLRLATNRDRGEVTRGLRALIQSDLERVVCRIGAPVTDDVAAALRGVAGDE